MDELNLKRLLMNSSIALEWCRTRQTADIAFFNEHMLKQINIENEIEIYLRQALSNHEFYLVYQPQVEIKTMKLVGFEAIVRWNHPRKGIILPDEFISLAEDSEVIIPMGNCILRMACIQTKKWSSWSSISP